MKRIVLSALLAAATLGGAANAGGWDVNLPSLTFLPIDSATADAGTPATVSTRDAKD